MVIVLINPIQARRDILGPHSNKSRSIIILGDQIKTWVKDSIQCTKRPVLNKIKSGNKLNIQ